MCPFQVVTILLLGLLGSNICQCANSTNPETIANGTTNFNAPQVSPAWRRNLLTSWFLPRNVTNVADHKNSQANLIRQLRLVPTSAIMTSLIYSMSVIPLFLALTSVFTPASNGFYGRRKRALVNESHLYRHLPLMNREETQRFLKLFETTLLNRKIYSEDCKKFYSCKVFHNAIRGGSFPTLADFEYALLNVFGIVAERYDYKLDLIPTVKMYYEIATNAFKGISCAQRYPCSSDQNVPTGKRKQSMGHSLQLSASEPNRTRTTPIASLKRRNQSGGEAPQ